MKKTKEEDNKPVLGVDKPKSVMIALKDFHIFQPPETDIKIKEGDELSKVPSKFHQNLITEGVMKGN